LFLPDEKEKLLIDSIHVKNLLYLISGELMMTNIIALPS